MSNSLFEDTTLAGRGFDIKESVQDWTVLLQKISQSLKSFHN